jgi:hypothetical protein
LESNWKNWLSQSKSLPARVFDVRKKLCRGQQPTHRRGPRDKMLWGRWVDGSFLRHRAPAAASEIRAVGAPQSDGRTMPSALDFVALLVVALAMVGLAILHPLGGGKNNRGARCSAVAAALAAQGKVTPSGLPYSASAGMSPAAVATGPRLMGVCGGNGFAPGIWHHLPSKHEPILPSET